MKHESETDSPCGNEWTASADFPDWSAFEEKSPIPLNNVQREARARLVAGIKTGRYRVETVGSCATCSSQHFEQIARHDRFGLPFRALLCAECGLVATSPYVAEKSLQAYYAEVYHPLTFGKTDAGDRLYLVGRRQGQRIFRYSQAAVITAGLTDVTVLEIGCASGSNLAQFRSCAGRIGVGVRPIGCDYDASYESVATTRFGVQFIAGGLDEVINRGVSADLVIMSHVFEHIHDLCQARRMLARVIRPNGLLYVEVPGIVDLASKYEYNCQYEIYRTHAHMYDFSLTTLCNSLAPEFGLRYGDEYCRAVFEHGTRTLVRNTLNDYERVKDGLWRAAAYHRRHPLKIRMMREMRRVRKRLCLA